MANFNKVAPLYDFIKFLIFQKTLDRASISLLKHAEARERILIIGGGSGALLSHFGSSHNIDYVESSKKMISKAKDRTYLANVTFYCQDIFEFEAKKEYDLIITPFVLDCFTDDQLEKLFSQLKKLLGSKGRWIHTDFYTQKKWHQWLISIMYYFFRMTSSLEVTTIPDFDYYFKKFKFLEKNNVRLKGGLIQSKYYQQIE